MLYEKNLKKFGMLKYVNTAVTFAEFPNEVSLCINISNCNCLCDGCHSPYLSKDIGEVLSLERLQGLIESNKGITLVGFMGGVFSSIYISNQLWLLFEGRRLSKTKNDNKKDNDEVEELKIKGINC